MFCIFSYVEAANKRSVNHSQNKRDFNCPIWANLACLFIYIFSATKWANKQILYYKLFVKKKKKNFI